MSNHFSYRFLILYTVPSIFACLLEPLASIVDTALVGQLNGHWLAALTVATAIFNSFSWIFNFLVHSSTQAISQAYAKRDFPLTSKRIHISITWALGLGLLSTLFLFLMRGQIYGLANANTNEELIPLIDSYFLVRLMGYPFSLLFITLISLLRGLERVRSSFGIIFFTTLSNIFISWFLLYRLDWGIQGAAYGTVAANALGTIICSLLLFSHSHLRPHLMKCVPSSSKRRTSWPTFTKNSLNLFGRSLFLTVAIFSSVRLAGQMGIASLAAHQILLQCWLFSSYFIDGLAITANILGAKSMSRGKKREFRELSLRLMILGGSAGLVFTLIFALGGESIWRMFTFESHIVDALTLAWPIVFGFQIFNSLAFVTDGLLFGSGDFAFLRKHMAIGTLFVFFPFAFWAIYAKSLPLLWWGLALMNVYRGVTGGKKMLDVSAK